MDAERFFDVGEAAAMGVCGAPSTWPEIPIHIHDHASLPMPLLWEAQARTASIFEGIGVRVVWTQKKRASDPDAARAITLKIIAQAPDDVRPGVLAQTTPSGRSIVVFYDRVRHISGGWQSLAPALLAHVFAHEIGHVLQAVGRHSETGILKPHWEYEDFLLMIRRRMAFTPFDASLMRSSIGVGSCGRPVTE